jgi:uncharacterized protein (TIGR03435 family)
MIRELVNHLWQSTLFAIVAGLLALALRRNRAQVRYWLWFSASIKFLVPFALLLSLGSQLHWARTAEKTAAPAVAIAIEQIAQPFSEASLLLTTPTKGARDWTPTVLLGAWACGFAGIVLLRIRGWLRIRAAVRSSVRLLDRAQRPAQAVRFFDIPASVEVRSSPGLLEPGVVGFLRPILLLPAGIADRLTPRQLEAVLAHELCHVRRRDNLFASVHMLVEALFWFHPLVWWIGARLVEERERACDEEVLGLGNEPQVYAEGIVNVCKLYAESPLACVSGVTGADLRKRIESIMTNRLGLRLTFAKKLALAIAGMVALALPIVVGMLHAQALAAIPKFEVASIRPCKDGDPGGGGKKSTGKGGGGGGGGGGGPQSSPGRISIGCAVLVADNYFGLIQRAYVWFAGGHPHSFGIVPIEGGPAWIHSELYSINAKSEGTPTTEMMQGPMLQALLEDRFNLRIHRETKEVPVYALTVARGGPKLKPSQEGSCTDQPQTFPVPPLPPGERYCAVRVAVRPPGVEAEGTTMGEFIKLLNLVLDRPVINRTGIAGKFNIHLKFTPDASTPRLIVPADEPASAPSIFTAIQEQLGLKLVPAKGPAEFLVIDHVERPTGN